VAVTKSALVRPLKVSKGRRKIHDPTLNLPHGQRRYSLYLKTVEAHPILAATGNLKNWL